MLRGCGFNRGMMMGSSMDGTEGGGDTVVEGDTEVEGDAEGSSAGDNEVGGDACGLAPSVV